MNVLSLFDGMSCGQIALNRLGININKYYASEIDKHYIKVTMDNYPNTIQLGDVRLVNTDKLPKIDLLIGGSPCQGFSVCGKRLGSITLEGIEVTTLDQYLELKEEGFEFQGQSYLFWEYIRILREIKPTYFLLENIRVTKKWCDMFNKAVGYEPILINSNLVSAQDRPRYYWTNIPNVTLPQDRGIELNDILDDTPISKPLCNYMTTEFGGKCRLDKGMFTCLNRNKARCLTKGSCYGNKYIIDTDNMKQRKLTRNELERLQTVPIDYTRVVTLNQAGSMLGNGWTVDVIAHILQHIKD